MPARTNPRDFHAIFQGVHALAIGVSGIVAVVAMRPPAQSGMRTGLFVGWLAAAAFAWLGCHMVHKGWTRGFYRSFLRWIATIPLALVWTFIVLVLCLALYVRVTGTVPGFVDSAMRAMFGGASRQHIEQQPAAPRGWKQGEPGTYSRGALAVVTNGYDNNGSVPSHAAERSAWVGKLLRGSVDDVPALGAVTSRKLAPIAGYQAWRLSKRSKGKYGPVIYDNYVLIDAKRDRSWTMTFAVVAPKPRSANALQVQFIKTVDLDV